MFGRWLTHTKTTIPSTVPLQHDLTYRHRSTLWRLWWRWRRWCWRRRRQGGCRGRAGNPRARTCLHRAGTAPSWWSSTPHGEGRGQTVVGTMLQVFLVLAPWKMELQCWLKCLVRPSVILTASCSVKLTAKRYLQCMRQLTIIDEIKCSFFQSRTASFFFSQDI